MLQINLPILTMMVSLCAAAGAWADDGLPPMTLEDLGERLFFDVNLSANRTQACATCHDPEAAFTDPRGMASIGDDGVSVGDRNAPTLTYAALIPGFHKDADGTWRGGQFLDGRAAQLEDQAGGPPLNPIEMAMPDETAIVGRLRQDPAYVSAFAALFGPDVLERPNAGFAAMTQAIAAYERQPMFSPFNSKYDRYLRGETELTREEDLGRVLFFSQQFTNCNQCHQLSTRATDPRETFTDHRYHNIGVPANKALRELNGLAVDLIDEGLSANPAVADDPAQRGKFRTPTLRNVAVTAPYMHNGVFDDLRTVILFYNQYNTRSDARKMNPETGVSFGPPDVPETLSFQELTHGPALDDQRIDALVAFLKTLTDERYESLLEE